MKKFSKLLSSVMALAMVGCMSMTAFAAETPVESDGGQATGDVYVTATAQVQSDEVIYVTVTIPDMDFTYSFGDEGDWDQATLKNTGGTVAGWVGGNTATITLANRGNVAMTVSGEYSPEDDYSTITGEIASNSVDLASADNGQGEDGAGQATTGSMTLTLGGAPESAFAKTKVGTVTLTIAKDVD